MAECDFCSSPNTVRQYRCRDFVADSRSVGLLNSDGAAVAFHSIAEWFACQQCAARIDDVDLAGLLDYAIGHFVSMGYCITPQKREFMEYMYRMFLANRIAA